MATDSPTPPLPHLFLQSPFTQSTLEKIRAGRQTRLENLQGLSLSLLLRAILQNSTRPLLIIAPGLETAYRLEEELLFLSRNAGERTHVLIFPDYELAESANHPAMRKARRARLLALDTLYRRDDLPPTAILSTPDAALRRTLSRETYLFGTREIRIGEQTPPSTLADLLQNTGYEPAATVEHHGQYSRRGGLLDVFPPTADEPLRIEFLADHIEEIRPFNPETQRSSAPVTRALITPAWETTSPPPRPPTNLMRPDHREALTHGRHIDGSVLYPSLFQSTASITGEADCEIVLVDSERAAGEFDARAARSLRWLRHEGFEEPESLLDAIYLPGDTLTAETRIHISSKPSSDPAAAPVHRLPPLPLDLSQMADILRSECGKANVVVVSRFHRRLENYLDEQQVRPAAILEGDLKGGFRLADAPLAVFTDAEVFPRRQAPRVARVPAEDRAPVLIPSDIRKGNLVVHIDHGIGRYEGISTETLPGGRTGDFFSIRYGRGDRLFVPIEQLERIEKYIGATRTLPRIHPLHSGRWGRVKRRVKEKLEELAATLHRLYEERERIQGHAFAPDGMYMAELEASFPFDETPDQKSAIDEVKEDMERRRPMDRLVFGDVGFGKTEVALRAAMKATMDGRQVAMIAPTTLLVHQHDTTFRRRLARFPVATDSLSRLKTPKERKGILRRLATGKIDIIIGTHALLQKNVAFHNLGLIIVDEEQRFGVRHKEKLKLLKTNVDVVTLTATPIPRTLNMSLIGLRDVSIIETPPEDRKAVQTFVEEWNFPSLQLAVERELARGGQVYFLHNDTRTIHRIKEFLDGTFHEARTAVCHGQMPERELEDTMIKFLDRDFDILLCTTIIENGLDIPNANTLIVNGSENFGLSQLYQLRGRIGRSYRQSYAYFFCSPYKSLSEKARGRLDALRDFAELGSGYRLALRDLEIRGAGNLLGREQHGYITEVGFNLYTQMLSDSVKKLKGRPITAPPRAEIDIGLSAHLPETYIPDPTQRTATYKKLLSCRTAPALDAASGETRDRYGPPPEPAKNFLLLQNIRISATAAGIKKISTDKKVETTDLFPEDRKRIEAFRPFASPDQRRIETVILKDRIRIIHKTVGPAQLAPEILRLLNAARPQAASAEETSWDEVKT